MFSYRPNGLSLSQRGYLKVNGQVQAIKVKLHLRPLLKSIQIDLTEPTNKYIFVQ